MEVPSFPHITGQTSLLLDEEDSGIKKFHHFRVSSLSPGLVFPKQWSDSPEVTFKLLKEPWTLAVDEFQQLYHHMG